MSQKRMREVERENPKASKKAALKAFILSVTVVGIIIIVSPSIPNNVPFFSILFGAIGVFTVYNTLLNEIVLLGEINRLKEDK